MNAKPYIAPNPQSKPIGSFFRWDIPGEAVGVHLSLNVIELIERDATRAGEKMTAGVLLGRTHHGKELTLTVEHYESATPEGGASDSPFADQQALQTMLDRWRPGRSRMSVLGFYRSCPEDAVLNTSDLAAVQSALDITNSESSATRVTPLKGSLRNSAEGGRENRESIQDPERIFLLVEPRAGRLSTASLYLSRKGVVVCQSPRIPFNRAELAKSETASSPQSPEKQFRAPAYSLQETPAPSESAPVSDRAARTIGTLPWLRRWQWPLAGVSLLPIVLAVLISLRANGNLPRFSNEPHVSSDSTLGLKLDRSGSALKLSWDADTPQVRDASVGHLSITDGVIHRDLELTSSDLRGGTIFYTPLTDDVVLQLQIETPGSAEPLSASVRTLGSGISPSASAQLPTADVPPLPVSSVPPLDESALRQTPAPVASTTPEPSQLEKTPFVPKAITPVLPLAALPKATPVKLETPRRAPPEIEYKTKHPSAVAADTNPRSYAVTPNSAPAPVVEPKIVPVAQAPHADTPSAGTELGPADQDDAVEVARLISREDPVYPDSAKELGLAGTVEVHFTIGKDGQVHDVNVVKGFAALGEAAIEAVRKWRYSPAKVDGVPTESEASAVFIFKRS